MYFGKQNEIICILLSVNSYPKLINNCSYRINLKNPIGADLAGKFLIRISIGYSEASISHFPVLFLRCRESHLTENSGLFQVLSFLLWP